VAMFVDTVGVAAQSVAETVGTATTAGVLAGSTPAMTAVVPMGSEEVSAMLCAAIQEHNAQFLALTGANVADRAVFAADIAVSGVSYAATEVANAASLML